MVSSHHLLLTNTASLEFGGVAYVSSSCIKTSIHTNQEEERKSRIWVTVSWFDFQVEVGFILVAVRKCFEEYGNISVLKRNGIISLSFSFLNCFQSFWSLAFQVLQMVLNVSGDWTRDWLGISLLCQDLLSMIRTGILFWMPFCFFNWNSKVPEFLFLS